MFGAFSFPHPEFVFSLLDIFIPHSARKIFEKPSCEPAFTMPQGGSASLLVFVHHSDTGRQAHCHHVRDFNQVPFVEMPRPRTAAVCNARPTQEIVSRDPDRDVIASAGKLALLGFTIADQIQSPRLEKQS